MYNFVSRFEMFLACVDSDVTYNSKFTPSRLCNKLEQRGPTGGPRVTYRPSPLVTWPEIIFVLLVITNSFVFFKQLRTI
jgi:hypothetical protein